LFCNPTNLELENVKNVFELRRAERAGDMMLRDHARKD